MTQSGHCILGSVSDPSSLFAVAETNYSLNVIGYKLDLLRDNKTREMPWAN